MREQGRELNRDLPWRRTTDPYEIWISEVMLQQTQVNRVDGRWQRWLARFGTVEALAAADSADVLDEWQGLGYNRRALAVHRAARAIVDAGGAFPSGEKDLVSLPGIGPATAAGIRAFAFDLHGVYLETNVRAVVLHELFAGREGVPDRELVPVVEATCPPDGGFADDPADDPRSWYYALLDYGAYLKRTVPNPSRRSKAHARQSRFEGSRRQKRAALVRALLARRAGGAEELAVGVAAEGIELDARFAAELLDELAAEGFCRREGDAWYI
ncbi:MAG: adenine glycosylase [Coriobacteriia bacterium]|nr:adenine glycosylase [Coriobacteriia bacterium]